MSRNIATFLGETNYIIWGFLVFREKEERYTNISIHYIGRVLSIDFL